MSHFTYQADEGESQWAGTIHLIELEDVIRIEFECGVNSEEKRLHVYTKHAMITIKRADAIADFRKTFNQYLFTRQSTCNFVSENVNDNPAT